MRNPSGPTRWSGDVVAAVRRAMLPVLGGISGSTSTTWNGGSVGGARRRPAGVGGSADMRVPGERGWSRLRSGMELTRSLAATVLAGVSLSCSCAPRAELCVPGEGRCASGLACVAGRCEGATLSVAGTRRLVLRPVDLAVLDASATSPAAAPLGPLVLGRAGRPTEILLR